MGFTEHVASIRGRISPRYISRNTLKTLYKNIKPSVQNAVYGHYILVLLSNVFFKYNKIYIQLYIGVRIQFNKYYDGIIYISHLFAT